MPPLLNQGSEAGGKSRVGGAKNAVLWRASRVLDEKRRVKWRQQCVLPTPHCAAGGRGACQATKPVPVLVAVVHGGVVVPAAHPHLARAHGWVSGGGHTHVGLRRTPLRAAGWPAARGRLLPAVQGSGQRTSQAAGPSSADCYFVAAHVAAQGAGCTRAAPAAAAAQRQLCGWRRPLWRQHGLAPGQLLVPGGSCWGS